MEKFLAPEAITGEGDLNEQWRRFKREFSLFLTATDKGAASEKIKLALFLRLVGQRVNDLYETMQFVEGEDRTSWSVVEGKLDRLCAPRTSKHVTWDKFFQLKQEGRSLDQFMVLIRKQANDCEFGEMKENLMLHVLIRGVDSDRMRRRLLETEKLDLAKAVQMCQAMETTVADLQHMSKKSETVEEEGPVASIRTRKGFRSKENYAYKEGGRAENSTAGQQGTKWRERKGYSRCGTHPPRQCPAFGKQCMKCQKYNHFARVCRGNDKPTNLVEETVEVDSDSGEERVRSHAEDIFQIQVEKIGRKLLAKVVFQVETGTKQVVCQLDTAASCNVMTRMDYEKLGKPKLKKSHTRLIMYDGSINESLGQCRVLVINRDGKWTELSFEVMDSKQHTLLSLDTCINLQLLSFETESICVAEACQSLSKERILGDYADVFEGLGSLPGKYDIEIDTTVPPVQNRPRMIPYKLKSATEAKLREMEKAGIIKKVEELTDWISNMTVVWKADKKQIRICLDPRDLNKAIKRNHFNMPTIDDVLPRLNGAKVFSILDAKDGFLHIHLTKKSSYLTTFWGPNGRYRWCCLPFGLSSSPEEFSTAVAECPSWD